MSVNRDMERGMLQENQPIRAPSGAAKDNWVDIRRIDAAVYKNSDMLSTGTARYNESTHTGLTHEKNIEVGKHRLVMGSVAYLVTGCNTKPRLTNLVLKEVDDYGRG